MDPFTALALAFALAVLSFVISSALIKPPENAKPASLAEFTFPQIEETTPQAVVFGDVWTDGWLVIWYGDLRDEPIKKKVKTGLFSSKKQTVGYYYYMGVHMGLCRGPIDELAEIRVGDKRCWPDGGLDLTPQASVDSYADLAVLILTAPIGYVVEVTSGDAAGVYLKTDGATWTNISSSDIGDGATESGTYTINAPDLFGGKEKEGGIQGTFELMMGEADQEPSASLVTALGGLVPGFRGRSTLYYDGIIGANSPYPKEWSFRLRRSTKGWMNDECWYPAKATIYMADATIAAMNPAHIIYECATNKAWGRGLPVDRIDENSFIVAANTLCDEGFGLCLLWTRQEDLDQFIKIVIDHIGGALYVSRETGLLTLRLIRFDYTALSLPLYDRDSGLLSIDQDDTAASDTAYSEIVTKYKDPNRKAEGIARWQNPAAREAAQSIASTTTEYPGAPTYDLAARLAERDGRVQTGGLKRLKLRLDHRGWRIAPAGPFAISAPERGIAFMVVRAGKMEADGDAFICTCIEDVFGLPATSYSDEQESGAVPPSQVPADPADGLFEELSYQELAELMEPADLALLDNTDSFVGAMAAKPDGPGSNYRYRTKLQTEVVYQDVDTGDWAPSALLDGEITPLQTEIVYKEATSFRSDLGTLLQIEDEMLRIDGIDGTTKTLTVARGVADTIPATHADAERIWFREAGIVIDDEKYEVGLIVEAKLLPATSTQVQSESIAPTYSHTMHYRQARPYPPGDVKVNDVSIYLLEDPDFPTVGDREITWAQRNRLTQGADLIGHTEAEITDETDTTYHIEVFDPDDVSLRSDTTSGSAWTYDVSMIAADGSPDHVFVEIETHRDSLLALETYRFRIPLVDHFLRDDDDSPLLDDSDDPFLDDEAP
jgi:hypothetical protein